MAHETHVVNDPDVLAVDVFCDLSLNRPAATWNNVDGDVNQNACVTQHFMLSKSEWKICILYQLFYVILGIQGTERRKRPSW